MRARGSFMKMKICRNMHEISRTTKARNLHKDANKKYAICLHDKPKICIDIMMQTYADICVICIRVNKLLYVN